MHKAAIKASRIDWFVVGPALYLLAIGFVVQSSIANKTTGVPIELSVPTQAAAVGLALVAVAIFSALDLVKKRHTASTIYVLATMLLAGVLLFGVEANGAQRWINIASFQLQPTELAKLGLVFVLARIFDNRDATVNRFRTVILSLFVTAIPAALILMQPDLGSAIVLFAVWVTVLFASKLKLSRFAFVVLAIIAGVVILFPFMAEYQQERLVSYFNPERDTAGSNYNVLQAGIAIGSGGLTGTGIDAGSQSQLNFLPSQHTDFVFAVTAEKLGLIGAMSVVVSYFMILLRTMFLSWWTSSQYERSLLIGVATILFFHVFVNIGMNLGLVPVTGLPLPLLSYGGTFMFVSVFSLGLVSVISYNIKWRTKNTLR